MSTKTTKPAAPKPTHNPEADRLREELGNAILIADWETVARLLPLLDQALNGGR